MYELFHLFLPLLFRIFRKFRIKWPWEQDRQMAVYNRTPEHIQIASDPSEGSAIMFYYCFILLFSFIIVTAFLLLLLLLFYYHCLCCLHYLHSFSSVCFGYLSFPF